VAKLEFFYDYASPYSYLADTQLTDLRQRTGCDVLYRPVLVGSVYKATGNHGIEAETIEAKRRYAAIELTRWVALFDAPFALNQHAPIETSRLLRAAHAAFDLGVFAAFHAAVFPAFWAHGENLSDEHVIARVLRYAQLDAEEILREAAGSPAKDALRSTTEEAIERGVFDVPTFFVRDHMFFGHDRLPFVERALTAQR